MPRMSAPTIILTSVAAAATMPMTTVIVIIRANIVQTQQITVTIRTKTTTFANKITFARQAAMMGTNETQTTSVSVHKADTLTAMVFVALPPLLTTTMVSVLTNVQPTSLITSVSIAVSLKTKSTRAYVQKRTIQSRLRSTFTMRRDFAAHKITTIQMAFAVREEVKKTPEGMATQKITAVR